MVSFTPIAESKDTGGADKPVRFTPVDSGPAAKTPVPELIERAKDAAAPVESDAKRAVNNQSPEWRALMQSATYSWANELNADEFAAVVGAENAYRKATGEPVPYGMGEARTAMLHKLRESDEKFHEKNPGKALGWEMAGGFAAPGNKKLSEFIGGGANWLTRAGRSALTASGTGAIAGASDERDRVEGAKSGAEAGGAVGGGMHLFGSAMFRGLPSLAKILKTPLVETYQSVMRAFGAEDPKATPKEIAEAQKKALEYVSKLAESAKKTPEEIANNPDAAMGKPVLGAEAMGRPGISQLAAVGRRAGETPDKLESTLRTRNQYASSRVHSDLAELTKVDPSAIEGDFTQQIKALRDEAKPLYETAYKDKVDTPKLREFLDRDAVKKALMRARRIASNEGIDPETIGLSLKGPPTIGHNSDGALELIEVKNPTMRTWDYIKRGLDDVVEESRDKVTKKLNLDENGRAVVSTLHDLRMELFKESPAYEIAVAKGGEAPRQMEAYQAAKELLKPTVTEKQFSDRVGKMTPAQKEAFKGGLIADIYNNARNNRLRLKDMQAPAFVEKLRGALGFEEANNFLAKAEAEMRMQANSNRMMPGTQSATMELGAADAERSHQVESMATAAFKAANGDWWGAIRHIAGKPVAVAKTAELDQASRDEVGRLLMLPPKELGAVLGAHEKARGAKPAESFVRQLAKDPRALDVARRLTLVEAGIAAAPQKTGTDQ